MTTQEKRTALLAHIDEVEALNDNFEHMPSLQEDTGFNPNTGIPYCQKEQVEVASDTRIEVYFAELEKSVAVWATPRTDGLWTPWSQVLCYGCHGSDWKPSRIPEGKFAELTTARKGAAGDFAATCDACKCEIWISRYDVADLQAIRNAVGGDLCQTGGMCCNLEIHHGGKFYSLGAMDGIGLGVYPSEEAACEGDYESFDGYDSVEQAVAQLRKMGVSL